MRQGAFLQLGQNGAKAWFILDDFVETLLWSSRSELGGLSRSIIALAFASGLRFVEFSPLGLQEKVL
jgi:hypothetical protein